MKKSEKRQICFGYWYKYVDDLKQINNPFIQNLNPKIQDKLLKDYRIEANDSVIKTFEVLRKYLDMNEKIYY